MSEEKLLAAQERAKIDAWATASVAAMLERVRRVCITEYQWLIDALREP